MSRCRSCGCENTKDAINLFDKSVVKAQSNKWRLYVFLATGIAIREGDVVSKMVCRDCFDLVEKTYKYRVHAVANDKRLRESLELERPKSPTPVLHKSVENLRKQYPNIILPKEVYGCDVAPDIVIEKIKTEVTDDWEDQDPEQMQQQKCPLGNIIIKRSSNNKDVYEVINCIEDDSSDESVSLNLNSYDSIAPLPTVSLDVVTKTKEKCSKLTKPAKKRNKKSRRGKRRKTLCGDISFEEVIPAKKNRVFYNKDSRTPCQKLEVPQKLPIDSLEQKQLLTSSLGLLPASDKQTELASYSCPICSKTVVSSNELQLHLEEHLRCKFCVEKMKNCRDLELYKNHFCDGRYSQKPRASSLMTDKKDNGKLTGKIQNTPGAPRDDVPTYNQRVTFNGKPLWPSQGQQPEFVPIESLVINTTINIPKCSFVEMHDPQCAWSVPKLEKCNNTVTDVRKGNDITTNAYLGSYTGLECSKPTLGNPGKPSSTAWESSATRTDSGGNLIYQNRYNLAAPSKFSSYAATYPHTMSSTYRYTTNKAEDTGLSHTTLYSPYKQYPHPSRSFEESIDEVALEECSLPDEFVEMSYLENLQEVETTSTQKPDTLNHYNGINCSAQKPTQQDNRYRHRNASLNHAHPIYDRTLDNEILVIEDGVVSQAEEKLNLLRVKSVSELC